MILKRMLQWEGWNEIQSADLGSDFLVMVGVVIASLASFVTCLGLNLQKLSLCAPENANKTSFQQPKWVAGLVCVVVGSIIDFLSFGLAPQSLLAPLAALSLVWNLGMASYLLGEKYTRADIYATILIFVGTGVTISYASHEEKDYDLATLMDLWGQERMLSYGILVPMLLGLHYAFIKVAESGRVTGRNGKFLRLTGYAGFAGIIGGQSLLFAKSAVELLKDAFHGSDAFFHIQTYLIIGAMTGCLLLQITYLNTALKNFDSLYVIPVYESYWIIAGVVGGLVYFGEMEQFDQYQRRMFVLGCFITFSGLFVLTQKESSASGDMDKGQYVEVAKFDSFEGDSFDVDIDTDVNIKGRASSSSNSVEFNDPEDALALDELQDISINDSYKFDTKNTKQRRSPFVKHH